MRSFETGWVSIKRPPLGNKKAPKLHKSEQRWKNASMDRNADLMFREVGSGHRFRKQLAEGLQISEANDALFENLSLIHI